MQFLVDTMAFGPVAPFDAAAAVLLVGGLVVLVTWPENYGDASNKHTLSEQLRNAAMAIYSGATPWAASASLISWHTCCAMQSDCGARQLFSRP